MTKGRKRAESKKFKGNGHTKIPKGNTLGGIRAKGEGGAVIPFAPTLAATKTLPWPKY